MATPYDALFNQAAAAYQVPAWLLEALARRESSLNPNAKRWEGNAGQYSWGLGGILESTARGLGFTGAAAELLEPAVNVDLMGRLAAEIIRRQGRLHLADFYSEWNSGRPALWQTSAEVLDHVRKFLINVAEALNRPPLIDAPIPDQLEQLMPTTPAPSLLLVAAIVAFLILRK